MKITIDRSTLLDSLSQLDKVVQKNPAIPILSGVLIESNGGMLTLTATDGKTEIGTMIDDYLEDAPGSAVIPAKKLLEVVKKLPNGQVKIDIENGRALINPKKVELPTLDAEDFPKREYPSGDPIELDGEEFGALIRSTAYAVSPNEQTPILQGVCLYITDGKITGIATDRHRLSRCEINVEIEGNGAYVVPAEILKEIAKTKPDVLEIKLKDNEIAIKAGDYHYTIALLEGTYPDTSRLLPQTYKVRFVVKRDEMLSTLELAEKVNEDKTKVVKLTVGESSIDLSVKDFDSSMEDSLAAEVEGEGFTISANAKYLAEALKSMDSEKVSFKLTGKMNPVVIEPVGKDGVLNLVLPYRTGGG